jgi:LysR family cys regulon transcriptional activator
VWLAVPKDHALARRRRVSATDLAAVPVVMFGADSHTRLRVMRVLGPLGARVSVEIEGRTAALQYARMGFGAAYLSLVPSQTVRAAGLALRDVTHLFGAEAFWVIWRASVEPRGPLAVLLAELEG